MDLRTAAQLYLKHVHEGVPPTVAELNLLLEAFRVLKNAGIMGVDRLALEQAAQ